jgi:RimJ/RimL family protein N-acetyltransferase
MGARRPSLAGFGGESTAVAGDELPALRGESQYGKRSKLSVEGRRGVQLETDRLSLREFAADDWQDLNAYTSDPRVVQYMSFGPTTAEQAQAYIDGCLARAQEQPRRVYELAVVVRAEERVIGNVTLELERGEQRNASFAYLLNRQYWGKGYMTEAMRAVFSFGFDQLGLHRLADWCDTRNAASARVMEKLGMRREGHLRETIWKDGAWHDEYLYAILAWEWTGRPAG